MRAGEGVDLVGDTAEGDQATEVRRVITFRSNSPF